MDLVQSVFSIHCLHAALIDTGAAFYGDIIRFSRFGNNDIILNNNANIHLHRFDL